jgi:hypothetical protein
MTGEDFEILIAAIDKLDGDLAVVIVDYEDGTPILVVKGELHRAPASAIGNLAPETRDAAIYGLGEVEDPHATVALSRNLISDAAPTEAHGGLNDGATGVMVRFNDDRTFTIARATEG